MRAQPVHHDGVERSADRPAGGTDSATFQVIYPQLRRLAASWLRDRGAAGAGTPGATIVEPTMLVHEAWVKLAKSDAAKDLTQTHFFALAARAMRQILVDHARKRAMIRRRVASGERVTLSGVAEDAAGRSVDVLSLHEALERLEKLNPAHARIVELRFFAGMRLDEVARAMDVSPRTLDAQWAGIRAWLESQLRAQAKARIGGSSSGSSPGETS
jgi:RNA polymerase sigma factor (TIGR02999 family)